jgi:hypothetical protein
MRFFNQFLKICLLFLFEINPQGPKFFIQNLSSWRYQQSYCLNETGLISHSCRAHNYYRLRNKIVGHGSLLQAAVLRSPFWKQVINTTRKWVKVKKSRIKFAQLLSSSSWIYRSPPFIIHVMPRVYVMIHPFCAAFKADVPKSKPKIRLSVVSL